MKTRYKVVIGFFGIAVAGATFAPQLGFGQESRTQAVSHDPKLDKVVTKCFDHVNVNQIFAWLVEQGFNYVIKDDEFVQTRVSLNVENQTVLEAAQALADALDGYWQKDGHVYVFHKNGSDDSMRGLTFLSKPQNVATTRWFHAAPKAEAEPTSEIPAITDDQQTGDSDQSNTKMTPEQRKAFEKQMADLAKQLKGMSGQFGKMSPEQEKAFGKRMEDWGKNFGDQFSKMGDKFGEMSPEQEKAFEKQMEELGQKFGGDHEEMNPEQEKAFAKHMEEWGQKLGDQFSKNGQNWGEMNPEQEKAFEKQMEAFAGQFPKNGDNYDHMTPKQKAEFKKQMQDWGKNFSKEYGKNGQWSMNSPEWKTYQKQMQDWGKSFSKEYGKNGHWNMNSPEWKAYQKQMQDWGKSFSKEYGKNGQWNMNSPEWKAYQKQMQDWSQKFAKGYAGKGNTYYFPKGGQNSAQWKEFAKKWEQWGKQYSDQWKKNGGAPGEGTPMPEMPAIPPMTDMPEMPPAPQMPKMGAIPPMPPMPRVPKMHAMPPMPPMPMMGNGKDAWLDIRVSKAGHNGESIGANTGGMEQLLNSLTAEQRQIQNRKGYLSISDLSERQRGFLQNPSAGGSWTLTFKEHGKVLKLRS